MTTIVTRVGKGSPLTWTEVDSNFTNLNNAKYESGNNASFGTISGTTITASSAFSGALNGTVGATTPASGSFTSLTDSGNLTFTGTGNRITGEMSSGTQSNNLGFQTSTSNSYTALQFLPNGTGTASYLQTFNNSDLGNSGYVNWYINSSVAGITTGKTGTGTAPPLTFTVAGSERMRIDTSGNLAIGTTNPGGFKTLISDGTTSIAINPLSSIGYIGTSTNHPLAIITNNTERMRIASGGNVGIGIGSPSYKLDVAGQIASQDAYLITANSSGTPSAGAFIFRPASNTIALGTASTEHMRIHASGGVSIGNTTDSGASSLNVSGSISGGYIAHAAGTTAMAFGTDNVVRVTPNATATYTTTVPAAGAICVLSILTSGTTSYTITFGTGFKATGTLATGTVSARYFNITFVSDGTNLIEMSRTVAIA